MRADLDPRAADRPERMTIERMTSADIRTVMQIEALSFTTSWPSSAFASELNDNKLAHYFVGRVPSGAIVAYGGIWVILEDSHVTTIAVHPDRRGKKYGEEMLVHLLHEATDRGASWITLEARESNDVAQSLYRKYGFTTVPRAELTTATTRERRGDVGGKPARRPVPQPPRDARTRTTRVDRTERRPLTGTRFAEIARSVREAIGQDHRYAHVIRVTRLADKLAQRHGEDACAARLAGLLHDIARLYSAERLLAECEARELAIDAFERRNPDRAARAARSRDRARALRDRGRARPGRDAQPHGCRRPT